MIVSLLTRHLPLLVMNLCFPTFLRPPPPCQLGYTPSSMVSSPIPGSLVIINTQFIVVSYILATRHHLSPIHTHSHITSLFVSSYHRFHHLSLSQFHHITIAHFTYRDIYTNARLILGLVISNIHNTGATWVLKYRTLKFSRLSPKCANKRQAWRAR